MKAYYDFNVLVHVQESFDPRVSSNLKETDFKNERPSLENGSFLYLGDGTIDELSFPVEDHNVREVPHEEPRPPFFRILQSARFDVLAHLVDVVSPDVMYGE